MKTIDLLVLGHDGPILNAYLSTLAAYGLCPARMIRIVRVRDATLEPPMFRWLFGSLRTEAMSRYQLATTNHWPRWLWKNERRLAESVLDTTAASLDLPVECVRNITTAMKPEDFVIRTDIVPAPDINDPAVVEAVAAAPQEWILTTGGGIIRAPLLGLEGKRFLHVHPGHLPQIRGADGLLWSMLLRENPGASAIALSPGLDEGDIIAAHDFSCPNFAIPTDKPLEIDLLYRLAVSYFDPYLRARVLISLLRSKELHELRGTVQNQGDGDTFHFMNNRLRKTALAKFFGLPEHAVLN
jgi:hypothetical protein